LLVALLVVLAVGAACTSETVEADLPETEGTELDSPEPASDPTAEEVAATLPPPDALLESCLVGEWDDEVACAGAIVVVQRQASGTELGRAVAQLSRCHEVSTDCDAEADIALAALQGSDVSSRLRPPEDMAEIEEMISRSNQANDLIGAVGSLLIWWGATPESVQPVIQDCASPYVDAAVDTGYDPFAYATIEHHADLSTAERVYGYGVVSSDGRFLEPGGRTYRFRLSRFTESREGYLDSANEMMEVYATIVDTGEVYLYLDCELSYSLEPYQTDVSLYHGHARLVEAGLWDSAWVDLSGG
jgi:hypothetical protein